MRVFKSPLLAVALALFFGATAGAQARGDRREQRGANQPALAAQLRQRFGTVIRQRLGLNDEKWQRLDQVSRQFEQQRNRLRRDERQARLGLKAAMQDSVNADTSKIAQYLDQLTQAQRRRADLLEAEQKQLSTFLTPLQRAKYLGLQEQFAQRVLKLQQQSRGRRAGEPPLP